jgi:hypothetical protein
MTKAEFDELAHSLAYDFAASVIAGQCSAVIDIGYSLHEWWYSTKIEASNPLNQDVLYSIRYLEERKLLERHSTHADWIRVLDEAA